MKSDDKKVKFYSGLTSFTVLISVFNFVATHAHSEKCALPMFNEFVLTLMKLRLSLFDLDLSYKFGIHQTTVSRIFRHWVDIMFTRLKPALIKWPCREELRKSMPLDFRAHFKKCVVIVDCFEVFCEQPYPLKARSQTYSDYKHHNTVKFLIGIAPQGVITFISRGWGRRVSDKYLTEHCGILEYLLPGDQVLADRGFTIQEVIALRQAEAKLPSFTRGRKQLSQLEVESSRTLA